LKLLLDTCIAKSARDCLLAAGHDVLWAGEWSIDPGDEQILTMAYQQQRVIVTLDKDFGELAVLRKVPHAGIIRLSSRPSRSSWFILEGRGDAFKPCRLLTSPGQPS
jgi:predicted nuclease of predicted toxin-antitoxin system